MKRESYADQSRDEDEQGRHAEPPLPKHEFGQTPNCMPKHDNLCKVKRGRSRSARTGYFKEPAGSRAAVRRKCIKERFTRFSKMPLRGIKASSKYLFTFHICMERLPQCVCHFSQENKELKIIRRKRTLSNLGTRKEFSDRRLRGGGGFLRVASSTRLLSTA